MRSVAIYGLAPCLGAAPDDWESWALLWDLDRYLQADRLFDPHQGHKKSDPKEYGICLRNAKVVDAPVYVTEMPSEFPTAVKYPLYEVIDEIGDYFGSSCAYMLGLAILEGVDQIGLWGFDMGCNGEYQHQRPNCEYLIGFARGRGISVHIAPGSALMTIDPRFEHGRYGWQSPILAS